MTLNFLNWHLRHDEHTCVINFVSSNYFGHLTILWGHFTPFWGNLGQKRGSKGLFCIFIIDYPG